MDQGVLLLPYHLLAGVSSHILVQSPSLYLVACNSARMQDEDARLASTRRYVPIRQEKQVPPSPTALCTHPPHPLLVRVRVMWGHRCSTGLLVCAYLRQRLTQRLVWLSWW
ncbi:hypothetical protein SEVIR_5G344350v4 [Setaria viridis]|uniref:Uncharacterized protein n=1 Tax=Setaria viridis TaxID=4556 RepID=A0A4U6UQ10_SETVI|nr:hypothetical protein SEVIR_5G344350v2 [Setaria viridis]